MHARTTLAFTTIVAALSLAVSSGARAAQQSPFVTITIVVRDAAGGSVSTLPTAELTGQTHDGRLYTGVAIQKRDEFIFRVPMGTYTVEVSAPGYKTERRAVPVTDSIEIEVTLERSSRNAPAGSILAPKAREEVQKGNEALRDKRFDEAKSHLEKALQLAPTSPVVNYLSGLLYYYTGNDQTASEYLQKAVSLDQNNAPAFLALGEVYWRQKDYNHAVEALERALALEPASWRAEAILGSSYYRQGSYEKGREHAQRAMDIGREEASGTGFLLAKCLAALGKKGEAIEALQAFLKSQPPSPTTSSAQAMLKELQGAQ